MTWLLVFASLSMMAEPAASAPPPPWSAVLDCGRTIYALDPLISGTPRLLAGARGVEAAYANALARASASDAQTLSRSQEAWSKQRNMRAFKRRADTCIDRMQKTRVLALKGHGR